MRRCRATRSRGRSPSRGLPSLQSCTHPGARAGLLRKNWHRRHRYKSSRLGTSSGRKLQKLGDRRPSLAGGQRPTRIHRYPCVARDHASDNQALLDIPKVYRLNAVVARNRCADLCEDLLDLSDFAIRPIPCRWRELQSWHTPPSRRQKARHSPP